MNIENTLQERGSRYGVFADHARITQNIKRAMVESPNWNDLADDQRECLEMIAHKVGRILNGDPNYHDSWHDIVGYTKLVADRLAIVTETFGPLDSMLTEEEKEMLLKEPFYAPDNDDITITKVGEDIRPQVNFGEAVQIVDDLRFGDIVERDQLNVQFDGADEMMGQKSVDDCLAQDMSAHVIGEIKLAGSYRTPGYMGPRPMAHFRPDLTSEEIAMLEGRGDDAEVVGV